MGEGQPAERAGPLADVADVEWRDVFARAVAMARALVREPDIDDVVTEGITRLYEGSATYDPQVDGELAMRAVEVGDAALRGEQRKVQRVSGGFAVGGVPELLEAYALDRITMRDEGQRIAALDEAGLAVELAAAGRTLEGERAKGQALAETLSRRESPGVAAPQNHTRTISGFRPRSGSRGWASSRGGSRARRPTLAWLLMAAVAMIAAVAFVEREAIVLRFKPPAVPIELPVVPVEATTQTPIPQEAALNVRHEAWMACREMNLDLCETKLDEARKLDPAGENTQAVEQLRAFISQKRLPPPPKNDPFGKGVAPKAPKEP